MIELKGRFIKNDNGPLLKALLTECDRQGIKWLSGRSAFDFAPNMSFVLVCERGVCQSELPKGKQLTLADFEQSKCTVTEFVKCGFTRAWEAVKAFEEGVELFKDANNSLPIMRIEFIAARAELGHPIYRKVEREVTWKEEVKNFLQSPGEDNCEAIARIKMLGCDVALTEGEFIEMCHIVESLTDKPE